MSETVRTQVDLPRQVVDALRRRSEGRGLTLPEQIREVVRAYVEGEENLILRADDPIFGIAGEMESGLGDLSEDHDLYLYHREWEQGPCGRAE